MSKDLRNFFRQIQKEYRLIAPVKKSQGIFLSSVADLSRIEFTEQLTRNTFKDFLFPQEHKLFDFGQGKIIEPEQKTFIKQAIFGISVIDLRALHLYNQVFRHDPYYQNTRSSSLIIGYLKIAIPDQTFGIFNERLEEDTLEHLEFDVFILDGPSGTHFFSGSPKGQKILTESGIRNFENIEFVGPIKESGLDPQMLANYQKVKNSLKRNKKIWEELGRRCLACGKCSLVCPTCFCFSTRYQFAQEKQSGSKLRCWETCFYSDFSKVAGGHKFLESIAQRIYFWYEHKFVRIPDEFSIPGCVGCGRCIEVCPVAIDLRQTLVDLITDSAKLKKRNKSK